MTPDLSAVAVRLGGRLRHAWPLTGGVSAPVHAFEIERPDGTSQTLVLRGDPTSGLKPEQGSGLPVEAALMATLHARGLPVPRPVALDPAGLVLPFVRGTPPPVFDDPVIDHLADVLFMVHCTPLAGLPTLRERHDPLAELAAYLPDRHAGLALPALSAPPPVLLHGDFWPGNFIWQDRQLRALIDWEDSATGDAHADVATARLELLWHGGWSLAQRFTMAYAARAFLDSKRLLCWDLLVGSSVLAWMGNWGLDPADEARRRRLANAFVDATVKGIRSS